MKRFLSLSCVVFLMSGGSVWAKDSGVQMRTGLLLGPWTGWMSQSGYGHSESSLGATRPSAGWQFFAGFQAGIFILDYNMTWFMPQHFFFRSNSDGRKVDDAAYWSLMGLNVGIDVPKLPIEAYVGWERGWYGYSTGTSNDFFGNVMKVGLGLVFPSDHWGIKGEFRYHLMNEDDGGGLPPNLNVVGKTVYVGLAFLFGGSDDGGKK